VRIVFVASTLAALSLPIIAPSATALTRTGTTVTTPAPAPELAPYGSTGRRSVMPYGLGSSIAEARAANVVVPSFARQTGLACAVCHYQYLQLTPFGRRFKLNGYTLRGLKFITDAKAADHGVPLFLTPIPALAIESQSAMTYTNRREPGSQNFYTQFPQQVSLFYAGAITSHMGTLSQFTYYQQPGTFQIDNTDIRAVWRTTFANSQSLIFALDANNNPTVQDVWNSTPAWGWPFFTAQGIPGAAAGPAIESFGGNVVSFGSYIVYNDLLYLEGSVYHSAIQGATIPPNQNDPGTAGLIDGVAPYWRAALEHSFGTNYVEVGTFGMAGHVHPTGVFGPTNAFSDIGLDAQVEFPFGKSGVIIGRGSWINETNSLNALFQSGGAASQKNRVTTWNANVSMQPNQRYQLTLGWIATTGSTDNILYAPAIYTGSRLGNPNTDGPIEEFHVNLWQNARIGLQALQYEKFNGSSSNYDGFLRQANGNNTMTLFLWFDF
jgi:hypothetical protein